MKKSIKKACWIGPVVPDEEIDRFKTQSAAANLWQLNFLNALKEIQVDVNVLSYIPERTWPWGAFWISDKNLDNNKIDFVNYVSYPNISGLREYAIAWNHIWKNVRRFKHIQFDVVFTYNPLPQHCKIATYMRDHEIAKKWVSVLADDIVEGDPDLTVFLSSKYYEKNSNGPKYYMEGGVQVNDITYTEPDSDPAYIVYAGSQTRVTGIREFVQLYEKIEEPPFKLYIYGRGEDKVIQKISKRSNHIELRGFVSSQELEMICSKASGFVNPRSNSEDANTTFPSKILYYLQFEKPIISSVNASIDSRYDEFLFIYRSDDEHEMEHLLQKIRKTDYKYTRNKICDFKKKNSWACKVNELIYEINNLK